MNNTICSRNLAANIFSRKSTGNCNNCSFCIECARRKIIIPQISNCRTLNCVINGAAVNYRGWNVQVHPPVPDWKYADYRNENRAALSFRDRSWKIPSIEALNARASSTTRWFAWSQCYRGSRGHVLMDAWLCLRHKKKKDLHERFFLKTTAPAITIISARG